MESSEPAIVSHQKSGGNGPGSLPDGLRRQITMLAAAIAVLMLAFSLPLWKLLQFSMASQLYSYIPLVPFISAYLIWLRKSELASESRPPRRLALPLLGAGVVISVVAVSGLLPASASAADRIALFTLAFLLCLWGACLWTLGRDMLKRIAFPLAFLIFLVPFPTVMEDAIVHVLQHGSAAGAYLLLELFGTPVYREGTRFQLPGIAIDVAPECSGIRSSLVLFMVALVAGQLFLRRPWARTLLAVSMVGLGIARNALRIFILAQLCLHVDPNILDSDLHRRGGPVFFALSMIPFVLLLWFLRRMENRTKAGEPPS